MNLRKDHYWLHRAARLRRTRCSPPLPPRVSRHRHRCGSPEVVGSRVPHRSSSLSLGLVTGRTTRRPRPASTPKRARCPDRLLRGPTEESRDCGSLEAGAGVPSGNYRSRPATRTSTESAGWRFRPDRCPRASGYPTLLPPAEGARGVQCLLSPAPAEEGAPGGFFPLLLNPLSRLRMWQPTVKQKTIRLLAVDHSARASMKNAASCEN